MAKNWVFGFLTLTIALGLIGLLALSSESVHRMVDPERRLADPGAAQAGPVEPEVGPMYHGSGLMMTY